MKFSLIKTTLPIFLTLIYHLSFAQGMSPEEIHIKDTKPPDYPVVTLDNSSASAIVYDSVTFEARCANDCSGTIHFSTGNGDNQRLMVIRYPLGKPPVFFSTTPDTRLVVPPGKKLEVTFQSVSYCPFYGDIHCQNENGELCQDNEFWGVVSFHTKNSVHLLKVTANEFSHCPMSVEKRVGAKGLKPEITNSASFNCKGQSLVKGRKTGVFNIQ